MLPLAKAQGLRPSVIGPGSRIMIATRDIAAAATGLLMEPAPPRLVELQSEREYSALDVAEVAAQVLGKNVQLVEPPREAWQSILEKAGVGPAYAAQLVEMCDGIGSGLLCFEGAGRRMTGPTTLAESFRAWL